MCGIVAIAGEAPVAERLVDGLKRLEYRGYDSAGIAVFTPDGTLERRRAPGKIRALQAVLDDSPIDGATGIAHTRWATHGAPNEVNAHPHKAGRVTLVHNGIIENFKELREDLAAKGRRFDTDTDSETVAHLIDHLIDEGHEPLKAIGAALARLEGAFALAIVVDGLEDTVFGARKGSPLVMGLGDGEMYLGSDAFALAPYTNRVVFLEEGDWCAITPQSAKVFDETGAPVDRPMKVSSAAATLTDKGNYRHFMAKEIHEQPEVVGRTLSHYIDQVRQTIVTPDIDWTRISRVVISACGTASYAGAVARYWFEKVAKLPCEVEIASEFRYREPALDPSALFLAISQSGETADTLAALRYCKDKGLTTGAVVNVPESSIARDADIIFPTLAGPEIGVASTKAFTCQLSVLACLAVAAAAARGALSRDGEIRLTRTLMETPRLLNEAIQMEGQIQALSYDLSKARDVLYLGRGVYFPLALEGALKLKEISYIHAEGYAAGELKHGPIALIDETTPVVVLAPYDGLFEKTASSMQEVAARGGRVILISDSSGLKSAGGVASAGIEGPVCDPLIAPIVFAAPIQLLAYHIAVQKGTDVDQPRNLAKSVTVE